MNEAKTIATCPVNGETFRMAEVLELFRRAIETDDPSVMHEGFEMLFSGVAGVSASEEYDLRNEDYVMEMPQSGERITGRDRMRTMQESFPGPPPTITINRVSGARLSWLIEGVNDYGNGDLWHVIIAMEFAPDGRMLRDRRYYAKDSMRQCGVPRSSTVLNATTRTSPEREV